VAGIIQCADVDVLSGGEYVVYFGLSSGHVVGYAVSEFIDHANKNKIKREDEAETPERRHPPHRPTPCCQFIAHPCIRSTTTTSTPKVQTDGTTALTCGGEGTLGLSPGVGTPNAVRRPKTNVLLTGGADGTVKRFEIIARRTEPSSDGNDGGGGGLKLEHWPRLSTQRTKRSAHLFRGHEGPVTALVYGGSSGGVGAEGVGSSSFSLSKILSAGMDGTVRVWNPSGGGKESYRMDGFTGALSSLCLDGEILVTDGMGEMVCVHDFDVGGDDDEDENDMYEF